MQDGTTGVLPEANSYELSPGRGIYADNATDGIVGASDAAYIKALSAAAKSVDTADMSTTDEYYPDQTSVVKGTMSLGAGLPTANLFSPSALIPFTAFDKNLAIAESQKSAEEQVYLKGLQYDYTQIKDAIKNNVWLPTQQNLYKEGRQKYVDKYGEAKGTKAFRLSDDYKILTMKLNNYSKAFNSYYDEAVKMVTEYQAGSPNFYISDDAFKAASNFLGAYSKTGTTLETLEDINNAKIKFEKTVSIQKSIKDLSEALSKRVEETISKKTDLDGVSTDLSTGKFDVYNKTTITGISDEYLDTKMPDGTTVGEMYYNKDYKLIDDKPTYAVWKKSLIDATTHKIEQKLETIGKDSPLDYAEFALKEKEFALKKQAAIPTIKKQEATVVIGDKTKKVYNYDISSSTKTGSGTNNVNFLGGVATNIKTGKIEKLDPQTVAVSNVYIDKDSDESGNRNVYAVFKKPIYATQTVDGKPKTVLTGYESYQTNVNSVGSTIMTNYDLEDLPIETSTTYYKDNTTTVTYTLNGTTYNIPSSEVTNFLKDNPTAVKK